MEALETVMDLRPWLTSDLLFCCLNAVLLQLWLDEPPGSGYG